MNAERIENNMGNHPAKERPPVTPANLELVWSYLHHFYTQRAYDQIIPLLSENCEVTEPDYSFYSAKSFATHLVLRPPPRYEYQVLHTFEQGNSITLVVKLIGLSDEHLCSLYFEMNTGRISKLKFLFNPLDTIPV